MIQLPFLFNFKCIEITTTHKPVSLLATHISLSIGTLPQADLASACLFIPSDQPLLSLSLNQFNEEFPHHLI